MSSPSSKVECPTSVPKGVGSTPIRSSDFSWVPCLRMSFLTFYLLNIVLVIKFFEKYKTLDSLCIFIA